MFPTSEKQDNKPGKSGLDDLTRNQLQFNGLKCRVLGTFYTNAEGQLCLGSDLESYHSAVQLQVYKPKGDVLETIVNYISPIRKAAALEEGERLGIKGSMPDFPLGTIRYTSSNRLQKLDTDVISLIPPPRPTEIPRCHALTWVFPPPGAPLLL